MVVFQENNKKSETSVRLTETEYVSVYTNNADIRESGDFRGLLHQTVIIIYLLTRLVFELNVASLLRIRAIMSIVLSQNEAVEQATSSYIDDIYVNDNTACIRAY